MAVIAGCGRADMEPGARHHVSSRKLPTCSNGAKRPDLTAYVLPRGRRFLDFYTPADASMSFHRLVVAGVSPFD